MHNNNWNGTRNEIYEIYLNRVADSIIGSCHYEGEVATTSRNFRLIRAFGVTVGGAESNHLAGDQVSQSEPSQPRFRYISTLSTNIYIGLNIDAASAPSRDDFQVAAAAISDKCRPPRPLQCALDTSYTQTAPPVFISTLLITCSIWLYNNYR